MIRFKGGISLQKSKDNVQSKTAVALKYELGKNSAPVIVASGKGYVADRIVELGEKHGVPVHVDVETSLVLSEMNVGSQFPPEMYKIVATIYAHIVRTAEIKTKNNLKNR